MRVLAPILLALVVFFCATFLREKPEPQAIQSEVKKARHGSIRPKMSEADRLEAQRQSAQWQANAKSLLAQADDTLANARSLSLQIAEKDNRPEYFAHVAQGYVKTMEPRYRALMQPWELDEADQKQVLNVIHDLAYQDAVEVNRQVRASKIPDGKPGSAKLAAASDTHEMEAEVKLMELLGTAKAQEVYGLWKKERNKGALDLQKKRNLKAD